jgi:hypothetical protein
LQACRIGRIRKVKFFNLIYEIAGYYAGFNCLSREITAPPSDGIEPPVKDVPEPLGVIGILSE